MTQEDLSAGSGVHPVEISRIEHGQRDVKVSTVVRLAEALGLTASELLDGVTGRQPYADNPDRADASG